MYHLSSTGEGRCRCVFVTDTAVMFSLQELDEADPRLTAECAHGDVVFSHRYILSSALSEDGGDVRSMIDDTLIALSGVIGR